MKEMSVVAARICLIFHLNFIFIQDSEDVLQILLYTTLCHSDWLFCLDNITEIENKFKPKSFLLQKKNVSLLFL